MYLTNGLGYMVKDHSDSEMGNSWLSLYVLLFLSSRIPQTRQHFVIPVVEQWLEPKIAQWVNHVGSIQ